MGLQKYRADIKGTPDKNGAIPFQSKNWMGGPTLALVRNCPIVASIKINQLTDFIELPKYKEIIPFSPRIVYIRGEADTYFSIPAACRYKGKNIAGWLGCENDAWLFHAYESALRKAGLI